MAFLLIVAFAIDFALVGQIRFFFCKAKFRETMSASFLLVVRNGFAIIATKLQI